MTSMMADKALEQLIAGNQRFVAGRQSYPDQTPARRQELVMGQHPFAAILRCADSRVPPEMIFDQGLGNIFTVRVAGNILENAVFFMRIASKSSGLFMTWQAAWLKCSCDLPLRSIRMPDRFQMASNQTRGIGLQGRL